MATHRQKGKTHNLYKWPSRNDTSWELVSSLEYLRDPQLRPDLGTNRHQIYQFDSQNIENTKTVLKF